MASKRSIPAGKVLRAKIVLEEARLGDLETAIIYGAPTEQEFLNDCLRDGLERAIRRGRRQHRQLMAELHEAEKHLPVGPSSGGPFSERMDDDIPF